MILSAVAGLWGETGETGDLLAFKLTEFRHFDEHGDSGECTNARNRDEDFEARHEFRIGFQTCVQGGVDSRDLTIDLCKPLRSKSLQQRRPTRMLTVPGSSTILDQSEPRDVKLPHLINRLTDDRADWRCEQGAHSRQHSSIDRVGFCMCAGGLGKAPRL